ncbi:glycerol uptake facilitator protein [Algoriphagus boseongensis]|uniref:Glycerol uptake facilitator protein n=1 Tax=Algoriphagus boseongensis TaxID=1442587 RepID=A0A4R6T4S3_9BACT|nr:MIP/aquaporin family protein [Algoriphagus boseongensis]TDQ13697.1 glycerol uptake facilitator protein [Algoriphagus boseongensis]
MNPYIAEFIGTGILLLLGSGVVANVILPGTKGNGGGLMAITTAWALAVFCGVVIAGPSSGAHLNPAVTIGLGIAGKFDWAMAPGYIFAQIGGAMLGSGLAWLMYRHHFDLAEDPGLKRAPFCTDPAIRNFPTSVISEAIGTFVLIFVILYITGAKLEDANSTPIGLGSVGALPVAFLVWVIGLALGGTTGYAINPARDLGPRIMHQLLPIKGKGSSDWEYSWVPVLGPIIGAALAAVLYLSVGL